MSSKILFEQTIYYQIIDVSKYKNIKILFPCNKSCLPFDIFAATFYLITRYEEYIIHKKDHLNRYCHTQSIAFKNNFLDIPIIDYWVIFLKEKFKQQYPSMVFKKKEFTFYNTIDIDNAYAFLEKGFFRNFASSLKDLYRLRFKNIIKRFKVLFFNDPDPYDSYEYLLDIHNKYHLDTYFFFLLADFIGLDRSVSFRSNRLKKIINKIAKTCHLGIHSSFNSLNSPHKLVLEIKRFHDITHINPLYNRQHYLKLNLPHLYRNLIKNNIAHDYSMGYPAISGFRASTSRSFVFFDLEKNMSTNLIIHPFSIMDTTLNIYMGLDPEKAILFIQKHITMLKEIDGDFVCIWHNESFSENESWQGWKYIYIDMIKFIQNESN